MGLRPFTCRPCCCCCCCSQVLSAAEARERRIVAAEEALLRRRKELEREHAGRMAEAEAAVRRLQVECEHQLDIERDRWEGGPRARDIGRCCTSSAVSTFRPSLLSLSGGSRLQSGHNHLLLVVSEDQLVRNSYRHGLLAVALRRTAVAPRNLPCATQRWQPIAGTLSWSGVWRCWRSGWRPARRGGWRWRTSSQVRTWWIGMGTWHRPWGVVK